MFIYHILRVLSSVPSSKDDGQNPNNDAMEITYTSYNMVIDVKYRHTILIKKQMLVPVVVFWLHNQRFQRY